MRRSVWGLLAAIGLLLGLAAPASAYEPVNVVHTEKVVAGPYTVTVGFSTWPLKAMQSLDFTFAPDDGIAGKQGNVIMSLGRQRQGEPLARHPRKRDVWGLDVRSLPEPGDWTVRFNIEGPKGTGTGELRDLKVMEQPGPPMGLSWAISTIPLFGLIALIVIAWRRTRRPV
ncbi:hypothetical protein ALI144C_25930 [Actinosynnema sp. ALI-1.44]|uniref:hypothetical protein n=1 Tax=Actinosynnema sp. ALI-1.44 TaxID=1933779 RepID=UPI00097C80D5|nr:hypothetical protein [Actinosynnema sp. ALI-1.44]ONI79270.1 hypothetical protein ALI144C_25930 [Actinosynnema sp. ALI-1.44]